MYRSFAMNIHLYTTNTLYAILQHPPAPPNFYTPNYFFFIIIFWVVGGIGGLEDWFVENFHLFCILYGCSPPKQIMVGCIENSQELYIIPIYIQQILYILSSNSPPKKTKAKTKQTKNK
jgi:hypothetical protein